MPLSEGVQSRLTYKFYASGALASNAEAVPATAPGASGGRLLRRVSHTLNLRKNTYRSNEIRPDRQTGDFRHGARRAEGSISGELSPGTYFDFQEAVLRGTKVASITDSNTEFTSVAFDNAASTSTFGGGDPVVEGYRVGDVIRFTNVSEAANNSRNFTIVAMGGTSNRTLTLNPPPTTMSADTSFTVTRPGAAVAIPASGHVSRLVAVEDHDEVNDLSRLFTELRATGFRLGLPAEGMATCETMLMGRNMQTLSGAAAPFFTAPTAITTTGIAAAVNGLIRVGGTTVGVITALEIAVAMEADAPGVVGQLFPPDILLGTSDVTGSITALLEDNVLLNNFINEDEISILVRLDAGAGAAPEAITIHLPRVKFTGGDVQRDGQGAQPIQLPFQALRFLGATAGVEQTTIRIHDTAAT